MIRTSIEPGRLLEELQPHRRALRMRLSALRRRLRWQLALEGLAWVAGLALVLAGVSLVVDLIARFSLSTRMVLLIVGIAALAYVAWRRLIKPLSLKLADLDLAEVFNRRHPGVGERMATVLQLPRQLEGDLWVSPTMIRAAVVEHAQYVERIDLSSAIDRSRSRKVLALLALAVLAPIVIYLIWPTIAGLWARRWLLMQDVRWPQSTYLSVVGARDGEPLLVPRGEAYVVQVSASPKFERTENGWQLGGRGEPIIVESDDAPTSELPGQVSIAYSSESESHHGNFTRYEAGDFRYELPPVIERTEFTVRGGDDWLGPLEIEPVDRPMIKSLHITAATPGAPEKQEFEVGKTEGQLLFLPTTKMNLRLVSTEPLAEAEILGKGDPLPKLTRVDDTTYAAEWEMKESLTLEVRLVGQRASLSSKPYFLSIGLLHDREPRVTVRSTGVGRRVTPVARIPLNIRAVDDFGLIETAAELERTVVKDDKPESKTDKLHSEKPPEGQPPQPLWERDQEIALSEYALAPGNVLRVRGLAVDNCLLGSHTGYSRWISLQVVSPEELFYEILMRQRDQRQKFNTALQSAKKQAETLAQLADQEEAIGLVRSQQVIARQVWQIAGQLEATLLEMKYNDLGSEQARDLLDTGIIAPMRALHDDELSRLRIQFDTLASKKEIKAEERDASIKLQAEANTKMQQILDKMSQWESFVDVVNQLKQVIKSQNGLLETTEEMRKNIVKDLFDK